jgi:hypothetical protein
MREAVDLTVEEARRRPAEETVASILLEVVDGWLLRIS